MTTAGTSSDPGNNGPGRPTKLISTIRMAATVIGLGRECMSYSSSFIRIVTSHDAIRRGQAQLQRIIHELPRRGLLGNSTLRGYRKRDGILGASSGTRGGANVRVFTLRGFGAQVY